MSKGTEAGLSREVNGENGEASPVGMTACSGEQGEVRWEDMRSL